MVFTTANRQSRQQSNIPELEVDTVEQMRVGHPQLPEEDTCIIEVVKRLAQQSNRPLRVINLHCRTGFFASKLIKAAPEIELAVQERSAAGILKVRERFADNSAVQIFTGDLEEWHEPVDIIISKGIHHHQPRTYLDQVKRVLGPNGTLILADEFCPEYCTGEHAERILKADRIYLAGGYVLTNEQEVTAYEQSKAIPQVARDIERLRQKALWTWYRYVVDYAMERNCLAVVIDELRATYEDLITNSPGEHKLSPMIVERELELYGFEQRSKYSIAPSEPVELQSFFVYEFAVKA